MREIIKEYLRKLEFLTGLKQFREMTLEDAKMLIDILEEKVNEYAWMTEQRLKEILKTGTEGGYGDFYHINVRTIATWCNTYFEQHKQLIVMELQSKTEEKQVSEEEKNYWIKVGNDNFRERWQEAKNGQIKPLFEWGPQFYRKFVDNGMIDEGSYSFDMESEKKKLRLEGRAVDTGVLVSRKNESVWKQFVKESIENGLNLPDHI